MSALYLHRSSRESYENSAHSETDVQDVAL